MVTDMDIIVINMTMTIETKIKNHLIFIISLKKIINKYIKKLKYKKIY